MPRMLDRLGWAVAGAACLAFVAVAANLAGAGPLDPPGAPSSTMKTLDQAEPRHPITTIPYNIAVSGSYYLTDNLFGTAGQTGITVSASDVTIDLDGFTLAGGPGAVNGIILTPGTKTVNIRNGTVRGWGGSGIVAGGAANSVFESLSLVGNSTYGIVVGGDAADASNNIIRNCAASSNTIGVQLSGVGLVEGCTARDNNEGFIVTGQGATLRNNAASGNHLTGATVMGQGCASRATTSRGTTRTATARSAPDCGLVARTMSSCRTRRAGTWWWTSRSGHRTPRGRRRDRARRRSRSHGRTSSSEGSCRCGLPKFSR